MSSAGGEVYAFGPFQLDVVERRLAKAGAPITLAPKLFDTLVLLVRQHGRLLEKDVLMQNVWPDTFVTDATLAHNISVLRKVLGHSASAPVIETIAKKGYRFVLPVEQVEAATVATAVLPPAVSATIEPLAEAST